MLFESQHATTYLMAIVMFAKSVTILQIFTIEMYMILTLTFRMGKRSNAIFYLLAIAMFALSLIICEIFTVEMRMTVILTFRIGQDQL